MLELILITTIKAPRSWIIRERSVWTITGCLCSPDLISDWLSSSSRFLHSLTLWALAPRSLITETPKQLHPNRNTHGCLFCYSPLRFVCKHTHRRSSLRISMSVFSALERFHFIVMETQSGETSSCQETADTQDLWWKITDVKIKHVLTLKHTTND